MDNTTNNRNNVKDDLLQLELLEKEYEITLQMYQQAINNYIDSLNTVSTNPCSAYKPSSVGISQACYDKVWHDQGCITDAKPVTDNLIKSQTLSNLVQDSFQWATLTDDDHRRGCYGTTTPQNPNTNKRALYPITIDFAALSGRSWWGTGGLTEGQVNSQDECKAMCSSDEQCTGATFNPVRKYCWTRKGDGNLVAGNEDNIALIPKQKATLAAAKALNQKLIDLNEQITVLIRKLNPQAEEIRQENDAKQTELVKAYDNLWEQQIEMEKQLQEYLTLDNENKSEGLQTNAGRLSYRFWFIFTILILIITVKLMLGGGSTPVSVIFWIVMFIFLIVFSFNLTTPIGYLFWFGLLVILLLMKTGYLPSM